MTTPVWKAGQLYLPGDLVQPVKALASGMTALINASFESDLTSWTTQTVGGTGVPTIRTDKAFVGSKAAWWVGGAGGGASGGIELIHFNGAKADFDAGKSITVSGAISLDTPDNSQSQGAVRIYWLDASDTILGIAQGTLIHGDHKGAWLTSTLTAVAPAGTKKAQAAFWVTANGNGGVLYDNLTWSYAAVVVPAGLIYKAVQPAAGHSGNTEPDWPPTLGVQVTDNEVIWEAVQASRVVWQASPILRSGATEPTWPVTPGGEVIDGTIRWQAVSRRVEDAKCPNSKVVAIAASKVFAGDKDIVRFSATVNPLDWSSADDAGYLPTGLQQNGANDVAALNLYRSNLAVFNSSTFQMWQVDPDPASMALLDAMEGIGSTFQQAAQAVSNDLFFLTPLGVRTVGIAAGSTNLAAGDVGMPIDSLIQAAIAGGATPRGTYYPAAGQYWLAFGGQVFVYTMNQIGQVGAWSRYLLPFSVDAFAQLGNDLYVRHGDTVSVMDESAVTDEVGGVQTPFTGTVQWPWLDMGQPGVTKMLEGIDIVASGAPSIEIGYDQTNAAAFTPPYALDPDTLPGGIVPLPVAAPSLAVRVTFAGGQAWSLNAIGLYLHDDREAA